jgi:hypothetical protein
MILYKDEVEIGNSHIITDNSIKHQIYFDRLWETEERDLPGTALKFTLNSFVGRFGNQFCCMVVRARTHLSGFLP